MNQTQQDRDDYTALDDLLKQYGVESGVASGPQPVAAKAPEAASRDSNAPGFFRTVVDQDFISSGLARSFAEAGMETDPNFRLKDVPEEEFKELSAGIPEEQWEKVFGGARSRGHLYYLADMAKRSNEAEARLAEYGGWGIAGRLAANFTDPGSVLIGLASGGLSVATKAERLREAVTTARTAGKLSAARGALTDLQAAAGKYNTTTQAVRAGLYGGAENALIEGMVDSGDPTRDGWDVANAALIGFGLSAGFGKVFSVREKNALDQAVRQETKLLSLAEADAAFAARREEALGRLKVGPETARADLAALDEEVSAFRKQYEVPVVGGYTPEYRRALESGGRADAKNPNSSATGADQFVSGTWLGVVNQHAPELWPKGVTLKQAKDSIKNGRSSIPEVQALLDQRVDADLSGRMAAAMDGDNQRALEKADALVNRHSMYAMHHFGPSVGVKFAKAADDTPMESILSKAQLDANAYLKGKTKAEAVRNWDERAAKAGVTLQDGVRLADEAPAVRDRESGAHPENLDEPALRSRLDEIDGLTASATRRTASEPLSDALRAPRERAEGGSGSEGGVAVAERPTASEAVAASLTEIDLPRLQAERGRLVEALGIRERVVAAAPTRKALADLDQIDAARTNIQEVHDNIRSGTGDQRLNDDTLSAARAVGTLDPLHESIKPLDTPMPPQGRMQFASATKLIGGTFSGILRGHANETVRSTLGRLVGNSVGNVDGSRVDVGASEIATRIAKSHKAKFYSAAEPAYRDWCDRNGIDFFHKQTREVRSRFMKEVGQAIRADAGDVDPAVAKLASRTREVLAAFLKDAKEAGVHGFDNVEQDAHYLPRVFNFFQFDQIRDKVGDPAIRKLFAGAIKASTDGMDDELAERLADAYVKRMRELRIGSDAGLMAGMRWDDVGFLRKFLGEAGVDSESIEDTVNRFAQIKRVEAKESEGGFRYAKRRTSLDETYSIEVPTINRATGERGEVITLKVSDLFENNVEALMERYSRTMSGHIGLAKVGIKSRKDYDAMIRQVENELDGNADELKKVRDTADMAYKIITGQPVEDAHALNQVARIARDWNFTTTMNQAGFAQIPDLAALMSKGYLRETMRQLPSAFGLFKRTDGSLDDEFAREIEEWLGLGTDYHNNAMFSAYDHTESRFERALGTVGHTARVMGRGTTAASGMAAITSFSQRLAAKAIVMRITKEVTQGGQFSPRRLADLGLDKEIGARIAAQLKRHSTLIENESGGKTKVVNWVAWDDVDARDAMLNAVYREARRIVQEEDLGDTAKWMHSSLGKVLAQFRRFSLVSYSKQLLHGASHMDAETGSRMVVSMGLAALAYTARWELRIAQMEAAGDSEKAQEMREKYLDEWAVAKAAFANSSYSTLMPAVIDQVGASFMDERLFDTRTSGLSSGLLDGIPTAALFRNLDGAARGVLSSILRDDRQFDRKDAMAIRKLLPFQNLLGMDFVFTALREELPERDEDDDRSTVDVAVF